MTIRLNPNLSRAEIEAFSKRMLDDLRFENERKYSRVAVAPCAADTFPVVTVAEAYELDNLKTALARNDLEAGHRLLETHFGDAALDSTRRTGGCWRARRCAFGYRPTARPPRTSEPRC